LWSSGWLTKTAATRPSLSRISSIFLDKPTDQGNLQDQKQFLPAIPFDDNEVTLKELLQGPGDFLGAFLHLLVQEPEPEAGKLAASTGIRSATWEVLRILSQLRD